MKRCLVLAFILALSLTAISAEAHEFIVKPVIYTVEPGHKLPLSVVSAHVFMVSEEMEPLEKVRVFLLDGKEKKEVKLSENRMLMTLDGQVDPVAEGTLVLAGHREGMIWTHTTQGWRQASRKGLAGVIASGKYEKFAKSLVTVGRPDGDFATVVGHDLEIVPLSDPAEARVGEDLEFRILFRGAPLTTEVFATYDGFSDNQNTYAYFTETRGDGIAKVKITRPGVWMVRVQKEIGDVTEDYDRHVMRAVLTFRAG